MTDHDQLRKRFIICLCFSIFLLIPCLHAYLPSSIEANSYYQKGLEAKTLKIQQEAFNHSLKIYLSLADHETLPSSALLTAIGDNYFQLTEYAWAILFYYKALKNDPQNEPVIKKLAKAQENLRLVAQYETSPFERFVSFDHLFSSSAQYSLLLGLGIAAIVVLSLSIWISFHFLFILRRLVLSLLLILLLNLFVTCFFYPTEGIMIQSSSLYPNSSLNPSQALPFNLTAGTKVRILHTKKNSFIQIEKNDLIGYVPFTSAAIL